ncbi:hypothetical protein Pyn_16903 [Prunus yedoensis var. nudiflora]|uniref:Transmembrane protein n=1 Tax=Prunus yedoensis var. nudiflora TaxID=2094558 RepID=A0A314ZLY6_PRUYE|nr:hypothetical protein Pyn_16903 [Prunus yedoensis var. nudiflora]
MNTRYLFPSEPMCNSAGSAVSFSSTSPGDDRTAVSVIRTRSSRAPPSSFLMRMAMRISRARWFIFLRRVFHYQNGSRLLYLSQGDGFNLSDMEQQRSTEESRTTHLMNRCRTSLELFFAIWFVMGNVWVFDSRFSSFPGAPKLHVLCISLLAGMPSATLFPSCCLCCYVAVFP